MMSISACVVVRLGIGMFVVFYGGGFMPISDAIPIIGNLVSGWMEHEGARDQNQWNVENAREQMAFQERMSSTAHQREVQDLIAAGLNPILSASRGGSSSPSGAMAQASNPMSGMSRSVSSAVDAWKSSEEIKSMKQMRTIKSPMEMLAPLVTGGIGAIQDLAKALAAKVSDIPTPSDAVAGVVKVAEGVSANVASAVEKVKETAEQFGVKVADVLAQPFKFVSSVVHSAQDAVHLAKSGAETVARNKVVRVAGEGIKPGSFEGSRADILRLIAKIKDPMERKKAMTSYRLSLDK